MDHQSSELIERYQISKLQKADNARNDIDDDNLHSESDDDLLELLEGEDENGPVAKYREQRMQQLRKEFRKIDDAANDNNELGALRSISSEKEVMDIVTNNELVIVHFYQPNFTRCQIMDDRLKVVAEKHLVIKVLRIMAQDSPFLVAKLNIKVLPLVVIYKNGKELTRIVGFEKLGTDANDFTVQSLEDFLLISGVINKRTINFGSIRGKVEDQDDDLE